MSMAKLFKLVKNIEKESKNADEYNTGLAGEHLIVSAYQTMSISQLEKIRIVINNIIKKKKIYKRSKEQKAGEKHERNDVPDNSSGNNNSQPTDTQTANKDDSGGSGTDN